MEKIRKILVHLSKENAAPQRAHFVQSITGHFTGNMEDQAMVSCSLENNRFILCGGNVPLKRASFCPFKCMSQSDAISLPPDILTRGVDVGVAMLLQSANQRLLLTRRATSLKIFPNVWVPPGGHVELDEKLLDAGLRELREETGLTLGADVISSQLLGLWESVYPPMLSRGRPERHHIVTYILVESCKSHRQLQACLSPNPAEVSGCVWMDAGLVKAVVSATDGESEPVLPPADLLETVSVTEVSASGELTEASVPLSLFLNRAPDHGEDVERVSTGTKYALNLWLKTLEPRTETG